MVGGGLCRCDREKLEESLVFSYRTIQGERIRSRIDVNRTVTLRDSLAKNLYAKLFDW